MSCFENADKTICIDHHISNNSFADVNYVEPQSSSACEVLYLSLIHIQMCIRDSPGTGAWTGTLAASILDMDFKSSVIAVMLGVILAGIIMAAVSMGAFGALGAIF